MKNNMIEQLQNKKLGELSKMIQDYKLMILENEIEEFFK